MQPRGAPSGRQRANRDNRDLDSVNALPLRRARVPPTLSVRRTNLKSHSESPYEIDSRTPYRVTGTNKQSLRARSICLHVRIRQMPSGSEQQAS